MITNDFIKAMIYIKFHNFIQQINNDLPPISKH